jgi:hypothetical protein
LFFPSLHHLLALMSVLTATLLLVLANTDI